MKPILFFLHIPKTAGTTMREILQRAYGNRLQIGGIEHGDDRFPTDEVLTNIKNTLKDKDVYTRHLCYGLHEYLDRPYQYLTFLRDPIKRSISHFNYFLRGIKDPHLQSLAQQGIIAFHTDGSKQWHNMQTRFLAGRKAMMKDEIDETDLELAKQNLRDEIALLGIIERFDESLLYFQHHLNWNWPFYLKANQSKRMLKSATLSYEDLTSEEKNVVEGANRYDLELYDYGKQLFQSRLDASPIDFESELRRFAFYNRIYYFKTVTQNKVRSLLR